jgi:hypothetical protein
MSGPIRRWVRAQRGPGGGEAFRRVSGRHPDVDDREVGTHLPDELDRLGGCAGFAGDPEA